MTAFCNLRAPANRVHSFASDGEDRAAGPAGPYVIDCPSYTRPAST